MNAQQLRNSILQEAIEGRLVPQDPNDEPASVLLNRIRAEKKRLVKEGKLKKKDLEETPISEDEKPFEIPDSWEWVRLSKLCSRFSTGPFGTMVHKEDYVETNGFPLINPTNIINGEICRDGIKMVSKSKYGELSTYVLQTNDIVLARRGDLSKIAIVSQNEEGWLAGTGAFFMHIFDGVFLPYFVRLYTSSYCQGYLLSQSVGGTMNNLNQSLLADFLMPLPPLAEQKRIVAKIEELLPKVEEYGKAQDALNKLNEELPEKLKKSVLQEAITGKLVPQNPNDEPASTLLNRIREEKKRLVKEGKLKKKDLEETPISEDEIPFEIPDSWEWCRLGWIGDWGAGATPAKGNPEYYDNGTIPWLRTGELNNAFVYDSEIKVTPKALEKCSLRMCNVGDVLIAMYGATIGKVAIAGIELTTNQACCACTPYEIYNKYLLYYLMASKKTFIEMGEGGAQPNISREKIIAFPFPLPPLAEQHRIVAKIEELFAEIDKLK